MNKRFLIFFSTALVSFSAHAQWGIGMGGASQCPYGMNPAGGAINGGDEVSNLRGRLNTAQQKIELDKQRLERINEQIKQDRADMQTVLKSSTIDSIVEHRRYQRNVGDYQDCSWDGRSASAGTGSVDAVLPGGAGNPGGSMDANRVPPPSDFCAQAYKRNAWDKLAQNGGYVSDEVCDYNVGSWRGRPDSARSSRCKDGLRDFYTLMDEKMKIETEIARLDAEARNYERRLNRIQDEIAEGTYCAYCAAQRRGYAGTDSNLTGSVLPFIGMLAIAGVSLYNGQQQRDLERQRMILNARTGWGAMGPYPPLPGPGAFPGNPYPAMTPGYMGINNGMYGAMPGAIGRGGFGCQGTSPYALGNPYAAPVSPFMNSTSPNLFGNPYMNPMMNPAMQNSMFMPGYGPGFMPVLGNGINGYNPYNMFSNPMMAGNPYGVNPFAGGNPFMGPALGGNPYAPATLPYMGQNPFFQNPYQMGMGGYPFGGGMGMGMGMGNPYGGMGMGGYPYGGGMGMGNPYGGMGMGGYPYGGGMGMGMGNPYGGMGIGGYPYGGMGMGGYPYGGMGMGNPYGGMGMGNPYGGMGMGGNPYAPAFLPYMGGYGASPYGNPYAGGFGNPYGGAYGVPYGGSPYGMAGGPLVNYPGAYGGGGYGGGAGYALGNFYYQMEQLKQQINVIQGSPIFGGSAPAVLPYPGPGSYSSPIYNYPGTMNNPMPAYGNTPNVIRSR